MLYLAVLDSEDELSEETIKEIQNTLFLGDENVMYCFEIKSITKSLEQELCEDSISRADALRVAKNEYLRGWHEALCKALSEKYSIHCEEGNFNVIQEETITGLGLSMDCAVGKDIESYMSTISSVTPTRKKGHWIMTNNYLTAAYGSIDYVKRSYCGEESLEEGDWCPNCGSFMRGEFE